MPRLVIVHPRAFPGENHGLLVQHVTTLADLLRRRGWEVVPTDLLDPNLAAGVLDADVVLIQMLADPEVAAIIDARRGLGRPTVFEITDNFLALGPWLPPDHRLRSPLVRAGILHHAATSDAIQVYAPGLADLLAGVNLRIVRLDPYVPIPDPPEPKPPGFVFGWGGTSSHAADVAAAAPVVTEFCRRHGDVTFAYMGDRSVFEHHFGAIDPSQVSLQPFGTHDAYLAFVGGLHVGLAPLGPTPFNSGRTDTRFGAYAAHGVAAVLEDGPVYARHRERARMYGTPLEFASALEDLYSDPAQRAALGDRARAWAMAERSDEVLAAQRDAVYRSLMGAGPGSVPRSGMPAGADGDDGLHARLGAATGLEPPDALAECDAIVARRPGYEQARLLRAQSLQRLGRCGEALASIEGFVPSPVFADRFVEVELGCSRQSRPHGTQAAISGFRSPVRRAQLGDHTSVLARCRAVLLRQPYDHFALQGVIELLRRADPDAPELTTLYERACLVAPESVPLDRRPARLVPFLPT